MPGLVNIGTQPGEAAPGELSAGALLTAPGLVVMRDPTTLLPTAKYPPGYITANDLGGTGPLNTTAETTLLTGSQAAMWPAGVAIGDTLDIEAAGFSQSTTAANIVTINLYLASTLIFAFVFPSEASAANQREWQLSARVMYSIIAGVGAGAVRPKVSAQIAGAGSGLQSVASVSADLFNDGAAVTVATNAVAAGDLKATLSSGTATAKVVCNFFQARWFPMNR